MSSFFNGIKSFMHSISTSDHYAAYDPARPMGREDTAPLATGDADRRPSSSSLGRASYVPGMRSAQLSSSSRGGSRRNSELGAAAGRSDSIQLDDIGPIPSPELSWSRIDAWLESNYPELYDQVMEGSTHNDLNDLEHDLDCVLPADVRESWMVHDGQEPGGKPTGLLFGISLLDIESISEEWNVWRRTALKIDEIVQRNRAAEESLPKVASSSSAAGSAAPTPRSSVGSLSWIDNQHSCPPDAIQNVYAHTGWIPLAKDFDGNNIGIDLAPGPRGRYGQVIMFGREFDTKFVVAPSWGDFLAQFAADVESGQSFIDDDIENGMFAFKAPTGQLVSYFSVLRQRVERAVARSQPPQQPQSSASASSSSSHTAPHHAPTSQFPGRMSGPNISVSHAPVNSGRPTQRLISPTNSSASLPLKEPRGKPRTPSSLANKLNDVDLSHGSSTSSTKVPLESESEATDVESVERAEAKAVKFTQPEISEQPAAAKDAKATPKSPEVKHAADETTEVETDVEETSPARLGERSTPLTQTTTEDHEPSSPEPSHLETTPEPAETETSETEAQPQPKSPKKKNKKKGKN